MLSEKNSPRDEETSRSLGIDRIIDTALISEEAFYNHDKEDHYDETVLALTGFYFQRGGEPQHIKEKDPHHEYAHNSHGCRDVDFTTPADIVAGGCSQTYGQGVDVSARWSSIVGEKLGVSVATVAIPGWSTQSIINSIMNYIIAVGKPKAVLLYLPDFFRLDYVMNKDIMSVDLGNTNGDELESIRLICSATEHPRHTPKISKKPHRDEDVLPPETAAFMGGQVLRFFLEYCKAANIEVLWSTWDKTLHQLITYSEKLHKSREDYDLHRLKTLPLQPEADYSGYVPMEYFQGDERAVAQMKCHSEIRDLDPEAFVIATDSDGHIGTHLHAHVAEAFVGRLKSFK